MVADVDQELERLREEGVAETGAEALDTYGGLL